MKFQVGEIALTTRPTNGGELPAGTEAEVIMVGPWAAGEVLVIRGQPGICRSGMDYVVSIPGYGFIPCSESFLRKRPQRGVPQEVLRIFEQPLPVSA